MLRFMKVFLFVVAVMMASSCDGYSDMSHAGLEVGGTLSPALGTPDSLGAYCVGYYSAYPNPASLWDAALGGHIVNYSSTGMKLERNGGSGDTKVSWTAQGNRYYDFVPSKSGHCLEIVGPSQVGEFCNIQYYVSKPGGYYPYPPISWSTDVEVYVNGPGSYGYPRSVSYMSDNGSFQVTASTPVGNLVKTVSVSSSYSCP